MSNPVKYFDLESCSDTIKKHVDNYIENEFINSKYYKQKALGNKKKSEEEIKKIEVIKQAHDKAFSIVFNKPKVDANTENDLQRLERFYDCYMKSLKHFIQRSLNTQLIETARKQYARVLLEQQISKQQTEKDYMKEYIPYCPPKNYVCKTCNKFYQEVSQEYESKDDCPDCKHNKSRSSSFEQG